MGRRKMKDGLEQWHDFAKDGSGSICPICGKAFGVRHGLVTHLRLHRAGVIGTDGKATAEHLVKTKAGKVSAKISKDMNEITMEREMNKCKHEEAVKWNPYNKAVQCHKCGQVFVPKKNVINLGPHPRPSNCNKGKVGIGS